MYTHKHMDSIAKKTFLKLLFLMLKCNLYLGKLSTILVRECVCKLNAEI